MDNVTFTEYEGEEFAVVDRGNNELTVYPKAVWDELQAQKELGGTL